MRSLRLVALSADGKRLVLAADAPDQTDPAEDGERFELPVDDELRSALAGPDRAPAPPAPAPDLPPRVIQARIRAGETPEQVAESSGTRVERIMRFAHPVLQERIRVAEQAREARVRLSEGVPSVPLEQFMSERLRLLGADLDAVSWDAHRTEDGTWQVRADWRAGHKSGTTRWSYDLPARTVTPVDATTMDFAEGTRLVRVVPDVPAGLPAAPISRRGVAVLRGGELTDADDLDTADQLPDGQLPDGQLPDDEAHDVVPADGTQHDELAGDLEHPAAPQHAVHDEVDPDTQDTVVLGRLGEGETDDPRARIPAWEDIVFGVRRNR
ncbi:septation protein SepH [Modestobacter italicus]|uniref:septation protein SepH n=1 Tax=Modestobacter italicus (strain DSM 44449 / CECT 9708 / BC 501) TaxID=2732864 RepID=UPI001C95CD5D|nr:septation protein SepH [Modestobacter italicus]